MEKSFSSPLLSAICEGWDYCLELSSQRSQLSGMSKLWSGVMGNEG
jgi:hypothetical protein